MSEIAKRIKLIVDRGLAPSLKQAGFRRSSMNFFRQRGEAVQAVDVQSNRWNSGGSGSFTMNVGVDFAEVAKLMPGYMPMPAFPKAYCCILSTRVGEIMPARKDYWWDVAENTNAETLASELVAVWTSYIGPWLDTYSTVSALASTSHAGQWQNPYLRAAANIVAGDRPRAAQCVEAEMSRINEDPDANHHLAQLREWAAKQGLTVRT